MEPVSCRRRACDPTMAACRQPVSAARGGKSVPKRGFGLLFSTSPTAAQALLSSTSQLRSRRWGAAVSFGPRERIFGSVPDFGPSPLGRLGWLDVSLYRRGTGTR